MKTKAKNGPAPDDRRQREADKISRLRALRLAREAEKKEAAARDAAAVPAKTAKRRVRAAPQRDQPGSV
jgi:hypothetical protein